MADELAIRIRAARVEADMTRERLAVELGVSLSTIVRWETGRTDISMRKLVGIAKATNQPLTYFLGTAAA